MPQGGEGGVPQRLRLVFDAPDLETARRLKDELVRDDASRAPKAVERLKEGFEEAMAVMALPNEAPQAAAAPPTVSSG